MKSQPFRCTVASVDGPRTAWSLLPLLALAAIALVVIGETLTLRVPAELSLNYIEGIIQFDALHAARGETLYGDPATSPWTVNVYTPLYPVALAGLLHLGAESFAAGRMLSYLALLATAGLVVWSARRRSAPLAWSVAAFYLTLPLFVWWGALVRPDNLALLCSALGVVVVDRCAGRRALYWAVPLFLAAGLAKQSVFAGLAAALLHLAFRDLRVAARFAALFALAALIAVAALQAATGGWFWFNAVTANALTPFHWDRAWAIQQLFLGLHAPVMAVGIALLLATLWRRRLSLYALWFIVAYTWTLSAGKLGSDTNYFLEAMAALAFLAAHELPLLRTESSEKAHAAAGLGSLLAVALAATQLSFHHEKNSWIRDAEGRHRALVEELSAVEGPFVSDDVGLLLQLRKPLVFQPFIISQLARAGAWDQQPFASALREGRFARVIVRSQPPGVHHTRYTPRMRQALARSYQLVGTRELQFEYEVYAPRLGVGRKE